VHKKNRLTLYNLKKFRILGLHTGSSFEEEKCTLLLVTGLGKYVCSGQVHGMHSLFIMVITE